ncbi:helicase-associated domain-containing protein [Staphylococcus chromogenes]|nr:helicase-associated domain-containing protein [Staphylococcus chromogenes]
MNNSSSAGKKVPDFREWLAGLDDSELTRLLSNRPDVVLPLPPGITPLAARLQLRSSVKRAITKVNATAIGVLEALHELGAETTPVTAPEVIRFILDRCEAAGIAAPIETNIHAELEYLRAHALIFDPTPGRWAVQSATWHAVPSHVQLLPGANTPAPRSRAELAKLVDTLPARKRKILDTLCASGGLGITKDAAVDADPQRPIPQLISAGLLNRVDATTVQLPHDVRALLLDTPMLSLTPPELTPVPFSDDSGVSAGLEVLRNMRRLLLELGTTPAATLKGGGVGVRVITRLTKALDLSADHIYRLLSVAESARLLARGVPDPLPHDDDGGDYLAPTPAADEWLKASLDTRWRMLIDAWLHSPWLPHLMGTKDDKGTTIHALSPASHDRTLPETRNLVMDVWRRFGPITPADTRAQLAFERPLIPIDASLLNELAADAQWIGALTSTLTGTEPADLMPAPTTQLFVQSDMTVMSGGPLTAEAQSFVDAIGELESAGLASVYRITESSIRHALDSGLSGQEILDKLAAFSVTEVPQALRFLIEDVGRRHGSLRGGPALSYLRCEDPSALVHAVTAVGDKVAMRAIAPTVAIAQAPLIEVIRQLRAAGLQPVAEDAFGLTLNLVDEPSRVPTPKTTTAPKLDDGRIAAAVAAIRRNDGAGIQTERPKGTAVDPTQTLSVLQAAVQAGTIVTLGFVDKHGVAVHRSVRPVAVSAGVVDAIDPATGSAHRFRLHRITEVLLPKT